MPRLFELSNKISIVPPMKKIASTGALQEQRHTFNDNGLYSEESPGRQQPYTAKELPQSRKFVKLRPIRQSPPRMTIFKLGKKDRAERVSRLLILS